MCFEVADLSEIYISDRGDWGPTRGIFGEVPKRLSFDCTKALKGPSTPAAPEMKDIRISGGKMQALGVFSKTPCAKEMKTLAVK